MNDDVEGSQGMDDGQAPLSTADHPNRGGWRTFPFFIVMTMGMTLASGGLMANMIVYLIEEYNVKTIDASQITNLVTGSICLFPVLGAIIADSFLGCFPVIWISSFISFLGTLMLFITTILDSSTSQQCKNGSPNSCKTPSKSQFAVLYIGIALATLGRGGTRTTLSTMGANQFDKPKDQSKFFNWYFVTWYVAILIATTALVYVEDNAGWSWGFGICVGTNLLALAIFVLGSRFYRHIKPKGSPFTEIARVVVVTIRKRKALLSMNREDYYYGDDKVEESNKMVVSTPTNSLRFLNRAALRKDGDTNSDGSIIKIWNLCKVQEVEDVKILIKIVPLWSSSTFLYTPSAILTSLSIIQALTMDRQVGPLFKIPAGSIPVFCLLSSATCLTVFDHVIQPAWQYLIGRPLTPLQRIGIGHILNITSLILAAIVESRRLNIAHSKHVEKQSGSIVPMSVLWLVPQLVAVGVAEAFHFPGQTALFYQEFPKSLKNMATAVIALITAIAYYLSIGLIDLLRNVTKWLPDDLNRGRLDLVYWLIVVVGVMNFGYYLLCAFLYKYREKTINPDDNSSST